MYLPISLRLENRCCTIVGAGSVAERKVRIPLDHGALGRVVAPEIRDKKISLNGRMELIEEPYDRKFLAGSFLALAANDNAGVNLQVVFDARSLGILTKVQNLSLQGPGLIVVGNAVAAAPRMQWHPWESIAL